MKSMKQGHLNKVPLFYVNLPGDKKSSIHNNVEMKSAAFFIFVTLQPVIFAQNIVQVKTEKITWLDDGEYSASAVSPDGGMVLATDPGYNGLIVIDLSGKGIRRISSSAGAGYEPLFSSDGQTIFYRENEFAGMKRLTSLYSYDLAAGKVTLIESKARNLFTPAVIKDRLLYSADGVVKVKPGEMKNSAAGVCVMLEDLVPVMYVNGQRKVIKPNGDGNYIWVSISPDGKKLLYNFMGLCTYVCDLDGKIIAEAGRINAPRWLSDEIIIGMDDRDDGYRILSSDIICYSIGSGKTTSLTSTKDIIEMYPLPFPGGERIIYNTIKGELFIMTIKIR